MEQWKIELIGDQIYQVSSEGRVKDQEGNDVQLKESIKGYLMIPRMGNNGNMTKLVEKLFLPKSPHRDMVWYLDDWKRPRVEGYELRHTGRRYVTEMVAQKVGRYE